MKELANGVLNVEFLKTLWLQRLPSDIQTILSVISETLENLAKFADKIADVRGEAARVFPTEDKSQYPIVLNRL